MIELIQQQFRENMSVNDKLNITREFLQILALKIMSEKRMFGYLAFVGGTALRILFDLKRFSEDLDFSSTKEDKMDIAVFNEQLVKSFSLYGLALETKVKAEGNVQNIMMKFSSLLKELGLSELDRQKLSIKIEIDTNPPCGWKTINTIVNKIYMINIVHYDLSSLFAGKLHACFFRKFTKGRDFYDFVWYIGRKVKPNFTLLNNAIEQTESISSGVNEGNFKQFLLERVKTIDFDQAKKDVERFLEDKAELAIFDQRLIADTIERTY